MNTMRAPGRAGHRPIDTSEFGEIQNLPETTAAELRPLSLLETEEADASIPDSGIGAREFEPLTAILGSRLTWGNPVWSGDPIPRLRALQKKLVEYSLSLEEDDRRDCLNAISLVELAIQLRLRWLQMKRSDAEKDVIEPPQEKEKNPEEKKNETANQA